MAGSPELIKNKIRDLQSIVNKDVLTSEDYTRINDLIDTIYGALNTLVSASIEGKTNDIAESLIRDLCISIVNKFGNTYIQTVRNEYITSEEN
jgi:hypothetical protein